MISVNWRLSGAAIAMATAMIAAPAMAQPQGPADAEGNLPIQSEPSAQADTTSVDSDTSSDIVVTGSRIRRPDFDTPSPVVSLSGTAIQQAGTTNLTDFLTSFPALQGSSTS